MQNIAYVLMQILDMYLLLLYKVKVFYKGKHGVFCAITGPLVGVQMLNDWPSVVMLSYIIRSDSQWPK